MTAQASPQKAPAAAGGGLAMDWDDEEEATHVLDRDTPAVDNGPQNGIPPAAGSGSSPYYLTGGRQHTVQGIGTPPPGHQAPGARPPSLPPPPPSGGQAYARPPATLPPLPGTSNTGSTPPPSVRPVAPPPALVGGGPDGANGAAQGFPYQATTTPMQMPQRGARGSQPDASPALPPAPYSRSRLEATALLRPQPRPTGLFILAGVGVAVLVSSVFFLMPRNGQIAINVADAKGGNVHNLQVSVDGKLQCDSAPCVVHNLSAGSHTVKVEATGYQQPADKAVAVESGKDVTVDFTMLPMSPSGGTGIKVVGSQPGEKLYVDDREVGALPQEIHDLAPGSHRVRVAAGDRYAAVEKNITIAKDEFQDLGAVTLKVIKGRATVSLATAGASVFLVSGSDRRELTTLPVSIDLDPSKQWSLVATKAGYSDFTQPLSFDDGQAEKSFVVTLEPKAASPAPGSVSFSPPTTYTPPAAPPAPRPAAPVAHREPAPAAAKETGEGTLNMNSIPASSVTLDGKPIGSTPQIGITVSAGSHTVVFSNAEQGFKKSVTVTVAAGETKKVHP
jgi:serine/threonine-protein kinase